MKIISREIKKKIGNAILLVKLTDLKSKVSITMFFWYMLFTSSQNLGICKEDSQAPAVKQAKHVEEFLLNFR